MTCVPGSGLADPPSAWEYTGWEYSVRRSSITASIAGTIAAIDTPPTDLVWITEHQKSTSAAIAGRNIAPAISAHIVQEWRR